MNSVSLHVVFVFVTECYDSQWLVP